MKYCSNLSVWLFLAIVLVGVVTLLRVGKEIPYQAGDKLTVNFSIFPDDATGLQCASDESIGNLRCGRNEQKRTQVATEILRPFSVEGAGTVLLSGVFESPEVRALTETSIKTSGKRKRINLTCTVILRGTFALPSVRWNAAQKFTKLRYVWVAAADKCHVK